MKKKLDKKAIIAICVAAVVLVAAVVGIVIGVGGDNDDETTTTTEAQNEQQAGYVENENDNADISDELSTDEESTVEGESESTDDASNEENANNSENGDSSGSGNSTSGGSSSNNNDKTDGAGNGTPDIGAGSSNDPYMETINSSLKVTTVSIGAGKVVNYGIYRVGGMYLTINDADAYVIINGIKYTAKNGKVSVMMPYAMAGNAIMMEIGNSGKSAKSFTLSFSYLKGTYDNPAKVTDLTKEYEISLSSGEEIGYFYEYKATKDGVMRFYIEGTDSNGKEADTILRVTNNRNSVQRSNEVEEELKTDADGNPYVELEVKKGDEISICVAAKPNKRGKVPAINIVWSAKYE